MRCRRCHWPTAFWQRDLLSGLCKRCQKIAAHKPEPPPWDAVRAALEGHGEASLKRGMPTPEVEKHLIAAGLGPQDAAEVVANLVARRAPYLLATELLNSGTSREETGRRLVEKGVDPGLAEWVIDRVQRERSGESGPGAGRRSRLVMLGVAFSALGVVLLIGIRTAAFTAFVIGSFFVFIGQNRP
jgi:hypothetical protein